MRPAPSFAALLLAAITLGACAGPGATPAISVGPGSGTPAASVAPASAAPSEAGSPTASASPEPIPSEDLGPFSCDLPIVKPGTAAVANIVDVRTGTHAGYDRVVFEFEQGTPELTLDRAAPPFTEDASGLPLTVKGESVLRLTMRGGTKQTDAGTSSYDGPTDLAPGHRALVHLVEGGDFERQSTWYLALTAEVCGRVLLLDDPPRLVIDVEHP
jgi:hypothetical protein